MLRTLIDYSHQRLVESGEEDVVRRRHAGWAADLLTKADPGLRSGAQLEWLARLGAEVENVRAATAWATTNDPPLGLAMAGDLGWFCYMTDQAATGWSLLSAALRATSGASADRARAMAFAAALGKMSGHLEEAAAFGNEAQAAVPPDAPPGVLGSVLGILALADVQSGAVQSVTALLERARECLAGPDDRWWRGYVDIADAVVALYDGRPAEAVGLLDRSVATMREVGDDWMALMALIPHAYLAEREGRLDGAAAALEAGLAGAARFREALSRTPVRLALLTVAQARLALIRGAQGRYQEAVDLADRAVVEAGLGSPSVVGIAYQARGRAMIGLARHHEGREDLERAARLFQELDVGLAVAECLLDVGLSWLQAGNPVAAVEALEKAWSDATRTEDRYTIGRVRNALADAYAAAGNPAAASAIGSEAEAHSG